GELLGPRRVAQAIVQVGEEQISEGGLPVVGREFDAGLREPHGGLIVLSAVEEIARAVKERQRRCRMAPARFPEQSHLAFEARSSPGQLHQSLETALADGVVGDLPAVLVEGLRREATAFGDRPETVMRSFDTRVERDRLTRLALRAVEIAAPEENL